jgi:Glycosyltransferase family 87
MAGAQALSRPPALDDRKAEDAKTLILGLALAFICGTVFVAYVVRILVGYRTGSANPFGDFFALWSYGKIAAAHSAAELYNSPLLHARQVALGMSPAGQDPFPYPPIAIPLLLPLGRLPIPLAYLLWTIGTCGLFLWAILATCWRSPAIVLPLLIAPTTTLNISAGQTGFLSGALLIAGMRLAATNPVVSGILIGCLSFKPQLALLVPVALVAAGLWRTLATSCLTAASLALATTLLFGWQVWPAWLAMLPDYARMFDGAHDLLKLMPTVEANLRLLGLTPGFAMFGQAAAATAVATVIWRIFRRGPTAHAVAALLVGTFLCTPHALIYDAPMLSGALVSLFRARLDAGGSFTPTERLVLAVAVLFPFAMACRGIALPVSTPALVALLIVILADAAQRPRTTPAPSRSVGNETIITYAAPPPCPVLPKT